LEKEPSRRYSTALELVEEMDRVLIGEPIHARPIGPTARLMRWSRRKPALAGSLFIVLILLLVVILGSPLALYHINQARKAATTQALNARRAAYASDMILAHHALTNNLGRALQLLEKYRPTNSPPTGSSRKEALNLNAQSRTPRSAIRNPQSAIDLRGWEWRYLWQQTRSDELFTLTTRSNLAWAIAWSPDGKRIAVAARSNSSKDLAEINVWDASAKRILNTFEQPGSIVDLQFLANNELLVASRQGLTIRIHNNSTQQTIQIPVHQAAILPTGPGSLRSVRVSADGSTVAAAGQAWVALYDARSGQLIAQPDPGGDFPALDRALTLSSDGKLFAYYRSEGPIEEGSISVVLWDVERKSVIKEFKGHTDRVSTLRFSPEGRFLASGSWDRTVKIWDLQTLSLRLTLLGHTGVINTLAFSNDGQTLASGGVDQQIRLWSIFSGKEIAHFKGHTHFVTGIAFAPNGDFICTSSTDGTVRVWGTRPPVGPPNFKLNSPPATSSTRSPTGDAFSTFDGRGSAILWNSSDLSPMATLGGPEDMVSKLAYSPGCQFVAFELISNNVRIYSTSPYRPMVELRSRTNAIRALGFSRDGKLLAVAQSPGTGNAAGTGDVWDWTAEKLITELSLRDTLVADINFSPDGGSLGVGYEDGLVEVWSVLKGSKRATFRGQKDRATLVRLLSDGRRLVSASHASGLIKVWDLLTESEIVTLSGQMVAHADLAESVDGRRLAAAGGDGTVKIWDLESYQEVATLQGHNAPLLVVMFSPDGNTLTSVSSDCMRVWRAASLAEADAALPSQ
jgi:WD40 repeat protein